MQLLCVRLRSCRTLRDLVSSVPSGSESLCGSAGAARAGEGDLSGLCRILPGQDRVWPPCSASQGLHLACQSSPQLPQELVSLRLHHLQRRRPQRVGKCGICAGAQASTRLTGAATSFLTPPLVRGLCPPRGDYRWVPEWISWHVPSPLTCSSDAEPVKFLFQVMGATKSPASGVR